MFTLNDLPNWMTIMRIAFTPLIAVLIWIDEPAYGYQLALALYTIASVTASGWVFLTPALIILIREFMVSGLREFLAKQNVSAPVTRLAKWKTTAQILALGFLMGAPGFPGFPFAHEIGITLLWLAAILTVQTGSGYLINAVKHVTEKGKTANRTRS